MPGLDHLAVPSLAQLAPFMTALEHARASATHDDWRATVRASPVIRAWRFFLTMDPYTRWGLVKPRGYAGDATLMDFAYGHPSIQSHLRDLCSTAAGIYRATSAAKQSRSARDRMALLRDELVSRAARHPVTAISVAAGHARELEGLSADTRARIAAFTAIDLDPLSLDEARRSAGQIAFRPLRRNAIKDSLDDARPADLVYSLGLFDYLADGHASAVLDKMLALTATGGKCIVANLAPDAANLGYCEAIMDWWMVTRSEQDLRDLARSCPAVARGAFSLEVRRTGCFHYLELLAA